MSGSIGPLVEADEYFNHQIVETHASVLQSDLSWTEKVCGAVFARDGSLAIGFGFGKYVNRNEPRRRAVDAAWQPRTGARS